MNAISLGKTYSANEFKVKAVPIENVSPVQVSENKLGIDNKFVLFWDLMDTIHVHGYTRAAMSTIGKSAVGAGWSITKHPDYKKQARDGQRKKLLDFYNMRNRPWDNIKDFYGMSYKIMIATMYLRFFGQAAFHIVRDGFGNPVGMDFMNGFVIPNTDSSGYFKSPAFLQFPSRDKRYMVTYPNATDVVYITNPDWEGYTVGGTDLESITDYSLPLDIYLQIAAREYMKNRNTPEAFYVLSPDISSEAFDNFVEVIQAKYSGASNLGKSPIVVQGELEVQELRRLGQDLPYQESRKDTRDENLAVSGVPGGKLGIAENSTELRELRREFHETSMLPLFSFIEEAFYDQIHIRTFSYPTWMFMFHNPDFLTEVERATVDMRYYTIGVYNPNEIRDKKGLDEREDGDLFVDQVEGNKPSNSPLGNPDTGTAPDNEDEDDGEVDEPNNDDQDPPRGDQNTGEILKLLAELKRYKTFLIKRIRRGKINRDFETDIIPAWLFQRIHEELAKNPTEDYAEIVFSEIFDAIGEFGEMRN